MRIWILALTLAVGCGGGSTCDLKAISPGNLSGTLNGEAWSASGVTWKQYATGYSVSTNTGGGHELYLTMLLDIQGRSVSDVVADRDYPVEVELNTDLDGTAGFVHSTAGPQATAPGAWITLDRLGGGVLEGCFGFTASDDFDTYELEAAFVAEVPGA